MPLPSTQDVDARFAVFLNPIRDLTKNWEVDIAKYLEEYLEELAEVQITFDGGETMMNFAEAAMLIQGSATVYSKKVEFLWQMVLQMLELLSSKRKFETQGDGDAEGAAGGSNKGKPSIHEHTMDFKGLDNVGEGRNITLKEEEEDEVDEFGRKKSFAFLPATPLHLVEKESEKSKNRVNIYLSNGETIGGKDDFRLNRSYMTPKGLLCLDLPMELLLQEEVVVPAAQVLLAVIPEEVETDLDDARGFSPDRHSPLPMLDDDGPRLDLSPVPPMEPEKETDVPVVAIADIEKEHRPIEVGRNGLRRRAAADNIVTRPIKLDEPWKPMDPHEQSSPPRPVRAGRLRRPPPCSCHKATPSRSKKRKKGADKETVSLLPIDQHLLKHLPDLANNNMQSNKADLHPALRDQILEEEATRAELLRRGARVLVEDVCQGVAGAVAEGLQQLPLDADGADAAFADDAGDDDDDGGGDDVGPAVAFEFPDPHSGLLEDEGGGPEGRVRSGGAALNDTLHYQPDGEYEALVQQRVAEYIVNAQDYIASSDLTRRVNKWRSKISPILAVEEARQSFDIHSYGDQILRCFTTNGPEECIPFRNIVAGMQRNEVSRMFLSSLMLANTYNVEPILTESGDMAMDCLTLRLLSRVRHHEEMQEYVAPSQHTTAPPDSTVPPRRLLASPVNPRKRPPPKRKPKATNKAKVTRRARPAFDLSDSDESSDSDVSTSSAEPRVNGVVSPLDCGAIDAVMDGLAVCTDITHKAVNDPHLIRQDRAPKRAKSIDIVQR